MDELGTQIQAHATDLSAKFYNHFQENKNAISSGLEILRASGITPDTTSPEFVAISSQVVHLRKDLIDAMPYLPSYDQGKYEEQLKVLEELISQHRPAKAKFSFKRKPPGSSQPPTSTRTNIQSSLSKSPLDPPNVRSTSNLFLSNRTSEFLGISSLTRPGENTVMPDSSDVTLTDLRDCFVNLFPSNHTNTSMSSEKSFTITALHAKDMNRIVLVIPPMEGSVLLHNVHNSVIIVGCRQFRIHDATNTSVLLYTHSNPTIERSNHLKFGPYPEALRFAFPKSFLERASNHTAVQDFDWIKSTPSPNWNILESTPPYVEKILQVINSEIRDSQTERLLEGIVPL